jgi:hypothetical protein
MDNKNPRLDLANIQNKSLEPFPANTDIETLEFFDQWGVLVSSSPAGIFETHRLKNQKSEFFAVYINGELGYFEEWDSEIVLYNRIQNISREKLKLGDGLNPITY